MTSRHSAVPRGLAVFAFFGAGVVALVLAGLASRVPWTDLGPVLTSASSMEALRLSLVTGTLAALVATLIGVPVGWIFARRADPVTRVVRALVLLPMVLPPVVAGVALLSTFGRRGLLGDIAGGLPFSTAGAVVAQAFVALPFVVVTVEAGARAADPGLEEAASANGASRWFGFVHVVLPLLRPSVVAGALLAWARALGEFGATVTFAGNVPGRTRTLPLAVVTELQRDPDAAVALSVVLMAVSLVVLVGLRDRWLPTGAPTR